jgi:hypothetical protein
MRDNWKPLFILFAICWYLAGTVVLYAMWTDSLSVVARETAAANAKLDDCLRKAQAGRTADAAQESADISGERMADAALTESACQEAYRKALPTEKPSDVERPYLATGMILCIPALLYAGSKLFTSAA